MDRRIRQTQTRITVSKRAKTTHGNRPQPAFWILTGLLVLVFLTGGNSRADAPLLFILRPTAIIIAAYGLVTLRPALWRSNRHPLALGGAIILLTAAHLIPLPPAIWHTLPEHDLVRMIDIAAGLQGQWRPLSLVPSTTLNALYSLSVPVAVLAIAIQLNANDKLRILYVVLILSGVSAIIGLLQTTGVPINLYYPVDARSAIEATGVFANRNHQAALLSVMLPMLAVAARLASDGDIEPKFIQILSVAGAALIIPLLIVTGSRAGLVLGIVAIFITLFYNLIKIDRLNRFPSRVLALFKIATGAAILCIATLVTVFTERGLAFRRFETADSDLRPQLWASILKILPDYMPWGSGIGSFVEVYRSRETLEQLRSTYYNHAHNEYLEIAFTAGAPGLLLLLTIASFVMWSLWQNRHGSEPNFVLARLGGAIIILFACASITDYPLRTPLLACVFALAATWCANPVVARRHEAGGRANASNGAR